MINIASSWFYYTQKKIPVFRICDMCLQQANLKFCVYFRLPTFRVNKISTRLFYQFWHIPWNIIPAHNFHLQQDVHDASSSAEHKDENGLT
jgi:hypothetical protein